MSQAEQTDGGIVFPKTKKHYVWLSAFYGFCAGIDFWRPFMRPRFHAPLWPSQIWMTIAALAFSLWILSELLPGLSNRLEKLICVLTMIVFALGIPPSLDALGYHWAHVWGENRISTFIMTVAALLMFLRTFQVFTAKRELQKDSVPRVIP